MAFSDETKRSIWIMVIAGIVVALIGGAVALPKALSGTGADSTQSSDPNGTETPTGAVPQKVAEWFSEDLGVLPEPYPAGSSSPEVGDLLPQTRGSTYVTSDDSSITVEVPARYMDPDAEDDAKTYVVYRRGDITVLEALWWRCDWVDALVKAEEEGNAEGVAQSKAMLEAFPEFEALRGTAAASTHEEELRAVMDGDEEAARQWLATNCGR